MTDNALVTRTQKAGAVAPPHAAPKHSAVRSGLAAQPVEEISKAIIRRIDNKRYLELTRSEHREAKKLGDLNAFEISEGVVIFIAEPDRQNKPKVLEAKKVVRALRHNDIRARIEVISALKLETLLRVQAEVSNDFDEENHETLIFYKEFLRRAIKLGASDIHIVLINGFGNRVYRVNGRLLVDKNPLPASRYVELCNYIYNLRPTGGDGNWQPTKSCNAIDDIEIDGELTRWRFHSFPNEDGEHAHIVFRRNNITQPKPYGNLDRKWLNYSEAEYKSNLLKLGYTPNQCDGLMRMFSNPDGAVFIAGKTNAGKTTLLNEALTGSQAVTAFERLLICVEDVPELSIPRAIRTPIALDKDHAFSFSDAIRSALRRDADIIAIGEVREKDSGPALVQAVLSGHLVIASLHANNIISMMDRLDSFDVSREFLSGKGNLSGLIWQRLIPTLCEHCKSPVSSSDPSYQRMLHRYPFLEGKAIYDKNPNGCPKCQGLPPGRIVAAEILESPSTQMRKAILERNEAELIRYMKLRANEDGQNGVVFAHDHAALHAASGLVAPQEIEKQLGRFDTKYGDDD